MNILNAIDELNPLVIKGVSVILIVVIGLIAIKVILRITKKTLKKAVHIDDAMHMFVYSAVKIACFIILITIVLQSFGVTMPTIVAVLGAMGAAIALALKDSLSNVAGGVMIIINHPFKAGDLITVGSDRGVVKHIDLFLTTLETLDCKTITIPNGLLNTSVIYNETGGDIRRADCHFGVSYDADLEKVRYVLTQVCNSTPLILKDPQPIIGPVEHADSAVIFEVLAYCKTENLVKTKYYLMENVKTAFEENQIEIPYPHIDIDFIKP